MTRFARSLAPILILAAISGPLSRGAAAQEEEPPEFVGVRKCKICHKKESSGAQYKIWAESRHAKAYESLASEKALAEAEKRGIADPQEEPECLRCHVTAYPVLDDIENQKITLEEGISCESCHGPGGAYFKKGTMQAITDGEIEASSVGLVMPPTEETCLECHNTDSPFYQEFDFEAFKEKIAHPRPKE
jgi:nitrate/TMAO reductase-like tetraheme cytochrome c subunit